MPLLIVRWVAGGAKTPIGQIGLLFSSPLNFEEVPAGHAAVFNCIQDKKATWNLSEPVKGTVGGEGTVVIRLLT
jgi:hypothetical protein